jgi:hypothetical protein
MGSAQMANFSRRVIDGYLARGANASTTTAQGRSCEDLGEYIFSKFPGVELVHRNVLDAFGATETDLVFTNDRTRSGLHFLDPVLIVECKNYATSNVSSADIAYFATRLRQKGAQTGVLVTTTSVSGGTGHAGGWALESALIDGVTVLVVDGNQLSNLSTTSALAVKLLAQLVGYRSLGTLQI